MRFITRKLGLAGVSARGLTHHNYTVNYGNTGYFSEITGPAHEVGDIIFSGAPFTKQSPPKCFKFGDIFDGLSNTLMFGEVIQGYSTGPTITEFDGRGLTWWGSGAGFTTLRSPNSNLPDIMVQNNYCLNTPPNPPCDTARMSFPNRPANYAARSRHPSGVNVALCDGSVRFIADTINMFTWRALSTIHGNEPVGQY